MPEQLTKPKRSGQHYYDEEVALICLYKKSREAAERLAALCQRSPDAIDWVWAWRDREEKFQNRAHNTIRRQIRKAKRALGAKAFGSIEC